MKLKIVIFPKHTAFQDAYTWEVWDAEKNRAVLVPPGYLPKIYGSIKEAGEAAAAILGAELEGFVYYNVPDGEATKYGSTKDMPNNKSKWPKPR